MPYTKESPKSEKSILIFYSVLFCSVLCPLLSTIHRLINSTVANEFSRLIPFTSCCTLHPTSYKSDISSHQSDSPSEFPIYYLLHPSIKSIKNPIKESTTKLRFKDSKRCEEHVRDPIYTLPNTPTPMLPRQAQKTPKMPHVLFRN
ncbi:hypothetical protein EYC80_007125 [Monilinia laxa]|uniref:Uncharacterized protein n=1 Tax=Monilinia laxa TaxID=61186 RepID=A0A5N6K089_MONLA|nr:hypothetical protein EYC80_007125 [Monilinia laxa]